MSTGNNKPIVKEEAKVNPPAAMPEMPALPDKPKAEKPLVTNGAAYLPAVTIETLVSLDIVDTNAKGEYNAKKAVKNARDNLTALNVGHWTDNVSPAVAILLDSVGQNTAQAQKAGRRAALAMALVDANQTYATIVSPAGTPFKSASALFRALYPNLADSTVRNYINTGKAIYLPATNPKAPAYLKELATLEPGTALSAVGALNDENARKSLPSAIEAAKKTHGGKLTQSALKEAVKKAKNPEPAKKEDGTKGTANKDAKAAADMNREAWKALVRRGMTMESKGNERYIYIYESLMQSAKELFRAASKDGESALAFVDALIDALNI